MQVWPKELYTAQSISLGTYLLTAGEVAALCSPLDLRVRGVPGDPHQAVREGEGRREGEGQREGEGRREGEGWREGEGQRERGRGRAVE